MGRLDNKVAIVTGGAMGMGEATALALAREGARVAVADIDDAKGAEVVERIRQAGGDAFYHRTDVGNSPAVQALVAATVQRYGQLNVLVNNVGVAIQGSVTETTEEAWNRVININLTSMWRGMKYAIPEMIRAGGGSIINLSSVQSLLGLPGWAGYAASKGGVNALTQQAAVEYAPYNIRVNAIAPGSMRTPMNMKVIADAPDPKAMLERSEKMHAIERLGEPEEVANAIVFLASDEAPFITGVILRVDGGMVLKV